MADSTQTTDTDVLGAIVDLLRTGSDPAIVAAQAVLLRRIAMEGNVVPTRLPAPANITEVGGYINLLGNLGDSSLRERLIAGALGVAAPVDESAWLDTQPPITFVRFANDVPQSGPAQQATPPDAYVRSDMYDAFKAALQHLHTLGGMLPLLSPKPALPANTPGAAVPTEILPYLGRQIDVVPSALLNDANSDPIAFAGSPGATAAQFQLVANASNAPSQRWIVLQCDGTSCTITPLAALYTYIPLAQIVNPAGWYAASPAAAPSSLTNTGNITTLRNLTGLVNGRTRLRDELSLLYPAAQITASVFSSMLDAVWNGTTFA